MTIAYNNIQEVIQGIQSLDHDLITDEDTKTKFIRDRAIPVMHESAQKILELIYAKREELPTEFLEVAYKTAATLAVLGINGLQNGRGLGLTLALMEEAGVPHPFGDEYPEEKPDPVSEHLTPTMPEVTEMPIGYPGVEGSGEEVLSELSI